MVCVCGGWGVVLVEKREGCGFEMELLWLDHKPFSGRASAFRTGCRWQAHTLNRSYINTHFTEQIRTRQLSENHTHILYFNTFPTAFNLEDVISWFLQIYHDLLKLLYLKSYDTAQTFNSASLQPWKDAFLLQIMSLCCCKLALLCFLGGTQTRSFSVLLKWTDAQKMRSMWKLVFDAKNIIVCVSKTNQLYLMEDPVNKLWKNVTFISLFLSCYCVFKSRCQCSRTWRIIFRPPENKSMWIIRKAKAERTFLPDSLQSAL